MHKCNACEKTGSGGMPYWACEACNAVFCNNCKAGKSLASTPCPACRKVAKVKRKLTGM